MPSKRKRVRKAPAPKPVQVPDGLSATIEEALSENRKAEEDLRKAAAAHVTFMDSVHAESMKELAAAREELKRCEGNQHKADMALDRARSAAAHLATLVEEKIPTLQAYPDGAKVGRR